MSVINFWYKDYYLRGLQLKQAESIRVKHFKCTDFWHWTHNLSLPTFGYLQTGQTSDVF